MRIDSNVIIETGKYVEKILGDHYSDDFYYHSIDHTKEVVEAAIEIGERSELTDDQVELVILAAWLHDTGYSKGCTDHEKQSRKIAREFLQSNNFPEDKIKIIENTIEATKMPQRPKDIIGEVLCDADMYHLATNQFMDKSQLLKKEMEAVHGKTIDKDKWVSETLKFANQHSYFTNYGKYVLSKKKSKNVKKLKKLQKISDSDKYVDQLESELVKIKNKLDQEKEIKPPTRGVETMFRITSRNHLTLSGMADNKANIMISVNSIILSIVLTVLFRKLDEDPFLLIPAIALTATCLITIVFAILATRPNVSSGKFTDEDIKNRKTNLLFFGNFHGMGIDNYLWGMKEMMNDGDYLYSSLIKDIYYLGVVLGRKYKLLRTSYTVFMFGLTISIILFILAEMYPSLFTLT